MTYWKKSYSKSMKVYYPRAVTGQNCGNGKHRQGFGENLHSK